VVARSFLQRGLELHPNNPDLHFSLGLLFQSLGQIDESVKHYRKAIELQEPNAPALHWTQLGTAQLAGAKQMEIDAEASFRRALERDPGFAQAHYELGKLYFQRKDFERAEQSFENAVRYDPLLLRAYYQYGLMCIRNGKSEKGRMLLDTFNRKRALHASNEQGMSLSSPVSSPVFP
jgi:tetratricopeptide (TPR) repeat protein